LNKDNDELEPRSILCFDVVIKTKIYYFANIHFTNKEQTAKNELIEFLKFIHSRREKRIMAGDFNLFNLPKYCDIYVGYKLSYNFKNYLSYPNDNGCLDYVLMPAHFEFKNIELSDSDLSDHKGVFVEIK
jgi:endonuclease/exonuclease/phosphatase family metal-dependent hydrolase